MLVIAFLPRIKHLLVPCLQSPSAVVLESKNIKSLTVSIESPSICQEDHMPWSQFSECWVLSQIFHSFTFIKRIFSSSSISAIRVISSAYLRLLIFLPAILFQACASSSLAFPIMYSAYELNNQGDNIPLDVLVSWFGTTLLFHVQFCQFLTCVWISQEAGMVVWYSHLLEYFLQFVVIHTVKGFGIVT